MNEEQNFLQGDTSMDIMKLFLEIKTDIASIVTDLKNIKESSKEEKLHMEQHLKETSSSYKQELQEVNERLTKQISAVQAKQKALEEEIEILKHAEDKVNSERWKRVWLYIITAIGGLFVAKLPLFFENLLGN